MKVRHSAIREPEVERPRARSLPVLFITTLLMTAGLMIAGTGTAAEADSLEASRAAREAAIVDFWKSGERDLAKLETLAPSLQSMAKNGEGEMRARALLELGTVQRLLANHAASAESLTQAAELADSLMLRDIAFEAWIGVARAYGMGMRKHGAASAALEHAVDAAGKTPTPKQRFDLADCSAQLLEARGDIETALVDAIRSLQLAPGPSERFFAELGTANTLNKLVGRCHYRQMRDARSAYDGNDRWGACRRAAAAANAAYGRAARTAEDQGWAGLVAIARDLQQTQESQWKTLDTFRISAAQRTNFPGLATPEQFEPKDRRDVLVHRNFGGGGAAYADEDEFIAQFRQVIPMIDPQADPDFLWKRMLSELDAEAKSGQPSAVSLFLRGFRAGMVDKSAGADVELFEQGADVQKKQRESFFDPRHRGTMIENEPEIIPELARRLLSKAFDVESKAFDFESKAFDVLEYGRARGLGELAHALTRPGITQEDRNWLASVLTLDARASYIVTTIVEAFIAAEGRWEPPADKLDEMDQIRVERRALMRDGAVTSARLILSGYEPAGLEALRKAASEAGIPVLLFSAMDTDVVIWYVGPGRSDIRAVFLPRNILADKVQRLAETSVDPTKAFDATIARQLYFFLIAPIEDRLRAAKQILIVPQGPLIGLPFETLIMPESGEPLVQRWAVSYAPNATMALQALNRKTGSLRQITTIVDEELNGSDYVEQVISAAGLQPRVFPAGEVLPAGEVMPERFAKSLEESEAVHVLVHGEFNDYEPLLSELKWQSHEGPKSVYASKLAGLPLGGLRLAVLSSCESSRVAGRISNEIYGFPWALLVGGVDTVVLSRWQASAASSAAWMRHFYGAIAGGLSPTEAAAEAIRATRKEEGREHPYHWAAMQVTGR